jgi:4-hydroxy-3-methylbut-2-enyl diphosphate reductase
MKITLARHSGFCMGVRNAILRIVHEINSSDDELYVYGPLIHNPQTIDVLRGRGMRAVDSLDNISGKKIAIRTHGIPVGENRILKDCAAEVINLTCPRVAKVQSIIKKHSSQGSHTIITGDRNHAEVVGLMSYATHGVTVISDTNDVGSIPPADAYLVVSQTTFDRALFKKIVARIQEAFPRATVFDTICDSTRYRQEDVIQGIMSGNDTLVVIGGRNSANTKRLAQIGRDNSIKTFQVETEQELNQEDFKDSQSVLVTAGTSTPGWIINNVLEKLFYINFKKNNIMVKAVTVFLEFIVRTNLLAAGAAFFVTLLTLAYIGETIPYLLPIISFLFVFSMYSINNYFEKDLLKLVSPYKYEIYQKFGVPFLFVSIAFMGLSIYFASGFNPTTAALVAGSYLLGLLYSTNPVKTVVKKINQGLIRKIYNSKIVACFGWIIMTVLVPMTATTPSLPALISLSAFIFVFVYLRTALLDLIAFQGDLILGKETLPVLFGTRSVTLISVIISLLGMMIYGAITASMELWPFLLLLVNTAYFLSLMYIIKRLNYFISLKYELLVDFNFILLIAFYFFMR